MEFVFHTTAAGERERLRLAVAGFAEAHGISKAALNAIDLALEEHLTNIISYGFPGETPTGAHEIVVTFSAAANELKVEVTDDGRAFNPLAYPAPDLTIPAEERPIGGLGIHMIRKSVDRAEYSRAGDRNRLVLFKKLA